MRSPAGVVVGQIGPDLGDQDGVVGPVLVEPEHRRVAGGPGPGHRQLRPSRGSARPWSGRSGRCRRRSTGCSSSVDPAPSDHPHRAVGAAISNVLSWLPYSSAAWAIRPTLGTEPMVAGSKAPWARQSSMTDLVDAGVAAVGDDGEGVGLFAVRTPHVAGGADHGRHRGVDDHVARNVQVGDAPVGVDHGQARPGRPARRRTRSGSPSLRGASGRPAKMAPSPSFGAAVRQRPAPAP